MLRYTSFFRLEYYTMTILDCFIVYLLSREAVALIKCLVIDRFHISFSYLTTSKSIKKFSVETNNIYLY